MGICHCKGAKAKKTKDKSHKIKAGIRRSPPGRGLGWVKESYILQVAGCRLNVMEWNIIL
jgi:hypothetical protein